MAYLCEPSDYPQQSYDDWNLLLDDLAAPSTSEPQPIPKGAEGHLFGLWLTFSGYLPETKPNMFNDEEWATLNHAKRYNNIVEITSTHPYILKVHQRLDSYHYVLARYGKEFASQCEDNEYLRVKKWRWWDKAPVYGPITPVCDDRFFWMHAVPGYAYRTLRPDSALMARRADRIEEIIGPCLGLIEHGSKGFFPPLNHTIKSPQVGSSEMVPRLFFMLLALGKFFPKERPASMSGYLWKLLHKKGTKVVEVDIAGEIFSVTIRRQQAIMHYLQVMQGFKRMLIVPASDWLTQKWSAWADSMGLFQNFSKSIVGTARESTAFVRFSFIPPKSGGLSVIYGIVEKTLSLMITQDEFQKIVVSGCVCRRIPVKMSYEEALSIAVNGYSGLQDDYIDIMD